MRLSTKRGMVVFVMLLTWFGLQPSGKAMAAAEPGAPGDFGVGAIFGAPTGLSAKYWYSNDMAIDGAVAWHFGDDDRFQIHADHLWHVSVAGLNVPNGRLPLYLGLGLRVLAGDHSQAGIRIPLGASYL